MKTLYTLGATLLAYTCLTAQTSLSSNDISDIGDKIQHFNCDTIGVEPGVSGNGVTWDFSTLVPSTDTLNLNFIDPSGTPNAASFANATQAQQEENGALSYFELTSNEYNYWGSTTDDGQGGTVVYSYTDAAKYFSFPLNYGDQSNDNTIAGYNSGGIDFDRTGTITTEYDGFGTLILPTGTFDNVSRIRINEDNDDIAIYFGQTITIKTIITTYQWYQKGTKEPLLTIANINVTASGTNTISKVVKMSPRKSSGVGVNEFKAEVAISIFPNPATNNLFIAGENIQQIELLDVSGKMQNITLKPNVPNAIHTLSPGIYLVRINQNTTIRFVKH